MADRSYEIHPYSINNLISILASKSKACPETVKEKLHKVYFEGYFGTLKAQTVIVENDYIDRDYLDDYLGYYGSCFIPYERKCTRLHFFNIDVKENEFGALLKGDVTNCTCDLLNTAYLGFMVVKPLPQTFIGRTCLKTYDDDGKRRCFPVVRDYDSNLYGMKLGVRSLAFQEQDHVVSACATSALWSIFHATGMLFQHPILSPVEITKIACESMPIETRFMPNEGLQTIQMAQAIRKLDMEPLLIKADNENVFKSTLYAYINCGIPLLLGFSIVDVSSSPGIMYGGHAVTITGYSLGHAYPKPDPISGLSLMSSRIDRIYAHDDQVGPFSRIIADFEDVEFKLGPNGQDIYKRKSIKTSHRGESKRIGSIWAIPEILMIPLYHKIRIRFSYIREIVEHFDVIIEALKTNNLINLRSKLLWDVHLTTVNDYKSEILNSNALRGESKRKVLTQGLPRFLWRAKAYCGTDIILDLIFDATDIEQASFLQTAIVYDESLCKQLTIFSKSLDASSKSQPAWKILEWFTR